MKKSTLIESLAHAFDGIRATASGERNMKIHLAAAALVTAAGFALRISYVEWLVCVLWFAVVMAAELVNTAVESVVDLATSERRPLAKKAKDAAAGAVLVTAIGAAVSGVLIFLPKLIDILRK